MSRTYRRKSGKLEDFSKLSRWVPGKFIREYYVPGQKEYNALKAIYHSDSGTTDFKEPGPRWHRNLFYHRPLRRYNKQELQKFVKDEEYCYNCTNKWKKVYWT